MDSGSQSCELCIQPGGVVLWQSPVCRVIRVDEPGYPGFCRVIWQEHVREMSDLAEAEQQFLMTVVFAVEKMIRSLFAPDKINLASLGNQVPHLHWHVIPRWQDDRHFPAPIWGAVCREDVEQRPGVTDEAMAQALSRALANIAVQG